MADSRARKHRCRKDFASDRMNIFGSAATNGAEDAGSPDISRPNTTPVPQRVGTSLIQETIHTRSDVGDGVSHLRSPAAEMQGGSGVSVSAMPHEQVMSPNAGTITSGLQSASGLRDASSSMAASGVVAGRDTDEDEIMVV